MSLVVATDPYGVLRYGDLGAVSIQTAEGIWDSFVTHADDNPWFRGGDWQCFSVAGLVQPGLGSRLAALLEDSRSSFHLRSLVFDLLRDGACVPEMSATLLAILSDPDYTYSERRDATTTLAGWQGNGVDWPVLFERLYASGDIEAARLADETLIKIGVEQFSDTAIADIVLAGYGGFTGENVQRKRSRSEDYWALSQWIPVERCAGLLDALAAHFAPGCPGAALVGHERGLAHLVWTLIARQIPGVPPGPEKLMRWLDPKATRSACICLAVRRCLRDLPASIRSQADSFSANGSSLLGRSGTLNFASTVSARRYLRIVLRDKPVRRSISRIGICCRKCQRRITLSNAMSITPGSPDKSARGTIKTWVNSQWKFVPLPGQLSTEINSPRRLSRRQRSASRRSTTRRSGTRTVASGISIARESRPGSRLSVGYA